MLRDRVTIEVRGFSRAEALAAIPDLIAEFGQRPWLLHPQASWDETNACVHIQIERDQDDRDKDGQVTLDEVWDCVIATMEFSSERISFALIAVEPMLDS